MSPNNNHQTPIEWGPAHLRDECEEWPVAPEDN